MTLHIHVRPTRDLEFKRCSYKQLQKNIASGKWIAMGPITEAGGLIKTAEKTRGVYNSAGRVYKIEVPLDVTKDMPSASRFKPDPTLKGVFQYRGHYYRKVTSVKQVGQNKFDVTSTHGVYRLEGGKSHGGSRYEWWLEGPHLTPAITVRGFIDGLELLEHSL